MSHRSRTRSILSGTLRFAAVVFWIVSSAQFVAASSPDKPEGDQEKGAEASASERAETRAFRVIYDPETGEIISVPIRETGTLSAPIVRALDRSPDGLRAFELENGGKGVHLDGRYQHAYMVRVRSDGSLETLCTDHSHGAEEFLKGRSPGAMPVPLDK